jgi:hypothetical protein
MMEWSYPIQPGKLIDFSNEPESRLDGMETG